MFSLQRTSYLTQHRRGHSGDAVYGWSAVLLQAGEGSLAPETLVVQPRPVLAAGAEGGGAAPAPTAGGQEPDGQPGQQQRGLGQSGAAQPSQPEPRQQPRDGLPVLWPLNVSTAAPLQEARPQPPTYQQSGHERFADYFYFLLWRDSRRMFSRSPAEEGKFLKCDEKKYLHIYRMWI